VRVFIRYIVAALAVAGSILLLSSSPPAGASKGRVPACAQSPKHTWGFEESASHPFRIWFPEDRGSGAGKRNDAALARHLKEQMDEKIWPKLTRLMGTHPKADPQEICLVDNVGGKDNSLGNTIAAPGCNEVGEVPATILLLDTMDEKTASDVLAHEFMHALQYALRVTCPGTWWWRESTGQWAEDYVYPDEFTRNRAHEFTHHYFSTMDQPLPDKCGCAKDREYGSYVWPLYIARNLGPNYIGEIWRAAEKAPLLEAMNSTLPGGLKKTWKRFALDAWNKDPVNYFQRWDGLRDGAAKQFGDPIALKPGDDLALQDIGQVPHLAARYYSFKPSQGVRTLSVTLPTLYAGDKFVGTKPDEHAAVQAIVEFSGGSAEVQDWTGHAHKDYCFALPHQHVTGLTLVFSNSSPSQDFSSAEPAYVVATNIGCAEWHGTLTGDVHTTDGRNVSGTAHVTFRRAQSSPDDPPFYTPVGGTGSWQAYSSAPCSGSGSGSWSVASYDGSMTMQWGEHNNRLVPTRSYSGLLGGPFSIQWNETCPGDTGPHPVQFLGFGPWNTGGKIVKVSADGLHMQGTFADSTSDGTESWHWTMSSSG
jgi:hypothetical protein